jgi:hypothetical protein
MKISNGSRCRRSKEEEEERESSSNSGGAMEAVRSSCLWVASNASHVAINPAGLYYNSFSSSLPAWLFLQSRSLRNMHANFFFASRKSIRWYLWDFLQDFLHAVDWGVFCWGVSSFFWRQNSSEKILEYFWMRRNWETGGASWRQIADCEMGFRGYTLLWQRTSYGTVSLGARHSEFLLLAWFVLSLSFHLFVLLMERKHHLFLSSIPLLSSSFL